MDKMSNAQQVANEIQQTNDLARSLLGKCTYIIVRGAGTDSLEVEIGVVGPQGANRRIVKENSFGGARMALEQHARLAE